MPSRKPPLLSTGLSRAVRSSLENLAVKVDASGSKILSAWFFECPLTIAW
jgi:hypothetical protein